MSNWLSSKKCHPAKISLPWEKIVMMAYEHLSDREDLEMPKRSNFTHPPRVIVAVCTYRRNDALKKLLDVLASAGERDVGSMSLGVVVADDNTDQTARFLVESYNAHFKLGATYCYSGKRNISKARNLAVETASYLGDWIAMTDDDCEPSANWLSELLHIQTMTQSRVITGPLIRRAPPDAPKWIIDQPFLQTSYYSALDGEEISQAFTNNSIMASDIIRNNPYLRFDADFGRIGGEDMVFFRQVAAAGYKICFAKNAVIYENEEPERLTLAYQFRRHFWYGNTSVQTSLEQGTTRLRLAVHSLATIARAAAYPCSRVLRGEKPQMLYSVAKLLEALGKGAGVMGVKVNHK